MGVLSNAKSGQGSLIILNVMRGSLCLLTLLSTAFLFLVYFAPIVTLIECFSMSFGRKIASFLLGNWLALWPYFFEKINMTKLVFSGDSIPREERVLLIANHRTEVDWMYLWNLALRRRSLGNMKYILKSSLMKIPLFGWGFHVLEFISVKREWKLDEPMMRERLSSFSDRRDPLWLAIFPEGTDFTEQKCERSQSFATEHSLPILKNLLLPKIKGFYICVDTLRDSLDAVYDLTIAYKHKCPLFSEIIFGLGPSEVHMNVRRIPIHEIPCTESEAFAWLLNVYKLKDQLLSDFQIHGHFSSEYNETELSSSKGLGNLIVIIALTMLFTFLAFSSYWFMLYVGMSCSYLAFATYFDVRPVPVVDFVRNFLEKRRRD